MPAEVRASSEMADEEKDSGDLIRAKVGPSGAELAVSNKLPDLFERVFPKLFDPRKRATSAIAENILRKYQFREGLTDEEIEFVGSYFQEHEAKVIRGAAVRQRAAEIYAALPPIPSAPLLQPPSARAEAPADGKATAHDWVNKFREDAALVDDQEVREIYARVLAGEARVPGTFSLRTLGVLRYLDEEVARHFATMQAFVVNGFSIPDQRHPPGEAYKAAGMTHRILMAMADAGLIVTGTPSQVRMQGRQLLFRLHGHAAIVAALNQHAEPEEASVHQHAHMLTTAGMELARITDCDPTRDSFRAILKWISESIQNAHVYVAGLPSSEWAGELSELKWVLIDVRYTNYSAKDREDRTLAQSNLRELEEEATSPSHAPPAG